MARRARRRARCPRALLPPALLDAGQPARGLCTSPTQCGVEHTRQLARSGQRCRRRRAPSGFRQSCRSYHAHLAHRCCLSRRVLSDRPWRRHRAAASRGGDAHCWTGALPQLQTRSGRRTAQCGRSDQPPACSTHVQGAARPAPNGEATPLARLPACPPACLPGTHSSSLPEQRAGQCVPGEQGATWSWVKARSGRQGVPAAAPAAAAACPGPVHCVVGGAQSGQRRGRAARGSSLQQSKWGGAVWRAARAPPAVGSAGRAWAGLGGRARAGCQTGA